MAAAGPIDVGTQKQLFIDHRFIAASEGIELRANAAQKLGPLVDADGNRMMGHVSQVLDFDGTARLYVGADSVAIYESADGLQFTNTGRQVRGGVFTTVFPDPHEADPSRRWKIFWLKLSQPPDPESDGVYAGYSADGENFTPVGRVLPYYTDNPVIVNWDERIGKYVVFTRALELDSTNQRRIARIELDDPLQPWPYTPSERDTPFLTPASATVVVAADELDHPDSDIYYNATTPYPWASDVFLMFTAQFRHFRPDRNPYVQPQTPEQWEDFGLLEIQLAVSRDGIAWERPGREPYFPTGLADEWDRWYATMGPGLVRRGNYLYQYYTSSGRSHDSAIVRAEYAETGGPLGGIGVLRQRLDGFVSADADYRGGWLQTPAMVFSGNTLRLNVDTGAMGTVRVELRGEDGEALHGFSLDDCEEICGNYIDQAVYWKGNRDLSSVRGQAIAVFAEMTRAKLYAFQFTAE
ncbi:MAG: hypothetical protein GC168_08825 [Candidatus Hydrogenedens sp.]|nr:hypothetical protein [Candidatus Hydrogenedens sp.]